MSVFGYTESFGFTLIGFNSPQWQTEEYRNWRKLDAILALEDNDVPFAVDAGTENAFAVNYTPDVTIVPGVRISFKVQEGNTGPATVAVDGAAPVGIVRLGAPLVGGEIPDNAYVVLIYNGTHYELLQPRIDEIEIEDGSLGPEKLSNGGPSWDNSGNVHIDGNIAADGEVSGSKVQEADESGTRRAFTHASYDYNSARITFSTNDPSGGSNGDIWFKYEE